MTRGGKSVVWDDEEPSMGSAFSSDSLESVGSVLSAASMGELHGMLIGLPSPGGGAIVQSERTSRPL